MEEMINPVAGIKHIALSDIITLASSPSGVAILTFKNATEIPYVKAGVSFNFTKAESSGGAIWTTNLSGNLKTEIKSLKFGILIIKLESGEQLIIGDDNLPVKDFSLPESLMSKQFQITHKSWHKPFKIAV